MIDSKSFSWLAFYVQITHVKLQQSSHVYLMAENCDGDVYSNNYAALCINNKL